MKIKFIKVHTFYKVLEQDKNSAAFYSSFTFLYKLEISLEDLIHSSNKKVKCKIKFKRNS